MRIFRRPRAFVSYSHMDTKLRADLCNYLKSHAVEPIFDEQTGVGQPLEPKIGDLIETSDGMIVLGSRDSLKSDWCQLEVEHARSRGIPWYPVLVDDIPSRELPAWFTGRDRLGHGEVTYAICPRDKGWKNLAPVVEKLRRGRPLEPRWIVAILLFMALIVPIPMMAVFGYVVGQAGESVRSQQERIERINADIEASATHEDGPMRSHRESPGRREWTQRATNVIVAWDRIEGEVVRERHFLDDTGEIAIDNISTVRAPDGSVSLLKTRRIHPRGMVETVIEDEFDSSGALISKRVKIGRDGRWYSYSDIALSIYPAVVPAFPVVSYR